MNKDILIRFGLRALIATALLPAHTTLAQTTLAKWTFETSQPAGAPGAGAYITNVTAEVGAGTASALHAAASTYSSPAGNGSSHSFSSTAWAVGDFYQFALSTSGYSAIQLDWDQTSSNTGPGFGHLQYSTDGVTFTPFGSDYAILANASPNPTWNATTFSSLYHFTVDLSSVAAVNNAAVVYFRLVCPSTTSANGGTVAAAGTDRVDNFAVSGTVPGAPTIPDAGQPLSRTNNGGTTATFIVSANGTAPAYQWRKNGVDLSDSGNVTGSMTPTLTLTNVVAADAADYRVVVTNSLGSVTSKVATLTVIDPAINLQPVSRTNVIGDSADFFITAGGTPTLTYQWRFQGADIADATAASLIVTNVQTSNQGAYTIAVSNGLGGAVTSAVATLTILPTPLVRIAEWDFNAANMPTNAPVASVGIGVGSLVGGTTATYGAGSFSDPAGAGNSAWNSTTYASQGTGNKQRGVQFNTSTVGYQHILLTWEERHSDTASKYTRLQYSTDGVTFTDANVINMTATNNSFVFFYSDLSGIPAVNNNSNFAFRIVAEWESTAAGGTNSNYVATVTSYGTTGTIRFDLVNVFGDPADLLKIQQLGNTAVLTWTNPAFFLQSAPAVTGVYTAIATNSPYTNLITGQQKYFRLRLF